METQASYVTVGAFVMVCLFGLVVAMLWLTGAQYRQEFNHYRAYFTGAVTGLGRGTIVRYNGIEVGNVTELGFDPVDPRRVVVTLQTTPTLRLHEDSIASIAQQGLTGSVYVGITGGSTDSDFLTTGPNDEYPVIQSRPSTLQQLAESGPELVGRFNMVGERVSNILNEENQKSISEMLAALRNTTVLIDAHAQDLDVTLKNLKAASEGINRTLSVAEKTLTSADAALTSAGKAVDSLDTAFKSADGTFKKLGQLTEDADNVLTGQSIAQMTQLFAQSRALIAGLTRLTSDLERDPGKLIYGDRRQGYAPR